MVNKPKISRQNSTLVPWGKRFVNQIVIMMLSQGYWLKDRNNVFREKNFHFFIC